MLDVFNIKMLFIHITISEGLDRIHAFMLLEACHFYWFERNFCAFANKLGVIFGLWLTQAIEP